MTTRTPRYHFDLVCPRCGKTSEATADFRIPPPPLNCGDCLLDAVKVIEMKVLKVEVLQ